MRSYGQYCSVARALDILGDRWTMLIVRELLLRDGLRYTDLRESLPGIASNLLAERLRDLEAAGVVRREEAPPPVASTLFHLTERGREARPIVEALGRWGAPAMFSGQAPDDAFRGHWLAFPTQLFLRDAEPGAPPVTLEVRVDGEAGSITTENGGVSFALGAATEPDAALAGPPDLVLGVLSGALPLAEAEERGVELEGNRAVLGRFRSEMAAVPVSAGD